VQSRKLMKTTVQAVRHTCTVHARRRGTMSSMLERVGPHGTCKGRERRGARLRDGGGRMS
jgi:hypothetical protein